MMMSVCLAQGLPMMSFTNSNSCDSHDLSALFPAKGTEDYDVLDVL